MSLRDTFLLNRIRLALSWVIAGLILSGISTFPLQWETRLLNLWFGAESPFAWLAPDLATWISHVHQGVEQTAQHYPFFLYGLSWLGFAHFAIALAMVGARQDPLNNRWLITWATLICLLCFPTVFIFGWLHNIPHIWSLVDCIFPLVAGILLVSAQIWLNDLSQSRATAQEV